MVKITAAALMAVLASTAAAADRIGHRHLHPRSYPVQPAPEGYPAQSPPPAEYPVHTSPVDEHESKTETIPEAEHTSSVGYPVHSVPQYSNTTKPAETKTVYPVPETTPVADKTTKHEQPQPYPTHPAPEQSEKSEKPEPYPTHPAPEQSEKPEPYPTHPAPEQSDYPQGPQPDNSDVDFCAPVTVYVTAPLDTHTVSEDKPSPIETKPVATQEAPKESYPAAPKPEDSYPVAPKPDNKPAPKPEDSYPVAPKPDNKPAPKPDNKPSPKPDNDSDKKPNAPSTGKRGIIYKEESKIDQLMSSPNVHWSWNWNSYRFSDSDNKEYVPILNNAQQQPDFTEKAKQALKTVSEGYVMGPNEPDQDAQGGGAHMDVPVAVEAYMQYIAPFKGSAKLGSISITSDQDDSKMKGLRYLAAWKEQCDAQGGCPVDFVCLHWYGPLDGTDGSGQADLFKTYITSAISTVKELYGEDMKVWVTEFGAMPELPQDTTGNNVAFMKEVLPWLDSNNDVERYSYFMAAPEYLINGDGSLTEAGNAYCEA